MRSFPKKRDSFHPRSSSPRTRPPTPQTQRQEPSLTGDWIYGKHPVFEVLRAGRRRVHKICVQRADDKNLEALAKSKSVAIEIVEPQFFQKNFSNAVHQNVAARVDPYPYADWDDIFDPEKKSQLILALDCVQDPQNVATLCRSALSFGVDAILFPKDRSVDVTPVVCKASSGAVEHLRLCSVTNLSRTLEDFKEKGFWIYGTALSENSEELCRVDPAPKSVIVLGSEGPGLRPLVAKTCDVLMKIPMAVDFDSLNVAQAGTVCVYDFFAKNRLRNEKNK